MLKNKHIPKIAIILSSTMIEFYNIHIIQYLKEWLL